MLESTLEFLKCVHCTSRLELDSLKVDCEIIEGILQCKNCHLQFPIIEEIPILYDDFALYLSSYKKLGGMLYGNVTHHKLKKLIKSSLAKSTVIDDKTELDVRWSEIYQNSQSSQFYSEIKKNLDHIPPSDLLLEYGCSIGTMTSSLAQSHSMVFGVDRSFPALKYAKRLHKDNLDYILADILSSPFGKLSFDVILALNVLELVEPQSLLEKVSEQITSGIFVISDPYDFKRGSNSVKKPLDEITLRTSLSNLGFQITEKTQNPSHIPWSLNINSRATLNYKVDLVIGQKTGNILP